MFIIDFNVVLRQYKDMIYHRVVTATRDINLILILKTALKTIYIYVICVGGSVLPYKCMLTTA